MIKHIDSERIRLSILSILCKKSPLSMAGQEMNKGYEHGIMDFLQKDLGLEYGQMRRYHDAIYREWSRMLTKEILREVISKKGLTGTYAIKK